MKREKLAAASAFCMILILCRIITGFAAVSASVKDNVLIYSISEESPVEPCRTNLYILTNGSRMQTAGESSANAAPCSDRSGNARFRDISDPVKSGNTSAGLFYTDAAGNRRQVCSRVEYEYSYRDGRFSAAIKIYDPAEEVTGIAFAGIRSDGSANYYTDICGTRDISEYVAKMNGEEETSENETPAGEQASGEEDTEEKESRNEDIRESISEIRETRSGGGSGGGHRPPCILKRIAEWISSGR